MGFFVKTITSESLYNRDRALEIQVKPGMSVMRPA